MNAHVSLSYEQQLKAQYAAVRARLASAAVNARRKPEPASSASCEAKAIKAAQIPLWELERTEFDAHVTAFKLWRSDMLAAVSNPVRPHIRKRAAELGIPYDDLMSASRKKYLAQARQLLIWEIKTQIKPSISFPELGRIFGGKDHTTCLWALRRVEEIGAFNMEKSILRYVRGEDKHRKKIKLEWNEG